MKKASIAITAVVSLALMSTAATVHAAPKLTARYTGTIAAGATATNTIGSQVQGTIGNIKYTYPASVTNTVSVKIQYQGTNSLHLVHATTMSSSATASGAPAGTELVEAGDKLITDNTAGTTNLAYVINVIKGE